MFRTIKQKFAFLRKKLAKTPAKPKKTLYKVAENPAFPGKTRENPTNSLRNRQFQGFFLYCQLFYLAKILINLVLLAENAGNSSVSLSVRMSFCGFALILAHFPRKLAKNPRKSAKFPKKCAKVAICTLMLGETLVFSHAEGDFRDSSRLFFGFLPFFAHLLIISSVFSRFYRFSLLTLALFYRLLSSWGAISLEIYAVLYEFLNFFLVIVMLLYWFFVLKLKKRARKPEISLKKQRVAQKNQEVRLEIKESPEEVVEIREKHEEIPEKCENSEKTRDLLDILGMNLVIFEKNEGKIVYFSTKTRRFLDKLSLKKCEFVENSPKHAENLADLLRNCEFFPINHAISFKNPAFSSENGLTLNELLTNSSKLAKFTTNFQGKRHKIAAFPYFFAENPCVFLTISKEKRKTSDFCTDFAKNPREEAESLEKHAKFSDLQWKYLKNEEFFRFFRYTAPLLELFPEKLSTFERKARNFLEFHHKMLELSVNSCADAISLENRDFQLNFQSFDVNQRLLDIFSQFSRVFERPSLDFSPAFPEKSPHFVTADVERFSEIVALLLKTMIKCANCAQILANTSAFQRDGAVFLRISLKFGCFGGEFVEPLMKLRQSLEKTPHFADFPAIFAEKSLKIALFPIILSHLLALKLNPESSKGLEIAINGDYLEKVDKSREIFEKNQGNLDFFEFSFYIMDKSSQKNHALPTYLKPFCPNPLKNGLSFASETEKKRESLEILSTNPSRMLLFDNKYKFFDSLSLKSRETQEITAKTCDCREILVWDHDFANIFTLEAILQEKHVKFTGVSKENEAFVLLREKLVEKPCGICAGMQIFLVNLEILLGKHEKIAEILKNKVNLMEICVIAMKENESFAVNQQVLSELGVKDVIVTPFCKENVEQMLRKWVFRS